jgi:hypothetical protein
VVFAVVVVWLVGAVNWPPFVVFLDPLPRSLLYWQMLLPLPLLQQLWQSLRLWSQSEV